MNTTRALAALLALLLGAVGCQSSGIRSDAAAPGIPSPAVSSPAVSSVEPPDVVVPSEPRIAPPSPQEFAPAPRLADIYFDFDSYEIRAEDTAILDESARWLRDSPGALLLIEGHADERGTSEYNLGLGDLRAAAAMAYLAGRGVPAARMVAISYGKERAVCADHAEACWAQNRRAHFLIKPL